MVRVTRTLAVLFAAVLFAAVSGLAAPAANGSDNMGLIDLAEEACPCDAPPCACPQKRELVEAEEKVPCTGDVCAQQQQQQPPAACHLDNSCGDGQVKPKTGKVTGPDTIVVRPGGEADDASSASGDSSSDASASGSSSDDDVASVTDMSSVSDSDASSGDEASSGSEDAASAGADASASDSSSDDSASASGAAVQQQQQQQTSGSSSDDSSSASGAAAQQQQQTSGSSSDDSASASGAAVQQQQQTSGSSSDDSSSASASASASASGAAVQQQQQASGSSSDDSASASASGSVSDESEESEDSFESSDSDSAIDASSSEDSDDGDEADESAEESTSEEASGAAEESSEESSEDASVAAAAGSDESSEDSDDGSATFSGEVQQPSSEEEPSEASSEASGEDDEESGDEESSDESNEAVAAATAAAAGAQKAAAGAKVAATSAATSAKKAAAQVTKTTAAIAKQAEAREADVAAKKAEADALRLKLAQKTEKQADDKVAQMKAMLAKLEAAKVGGGKTSKEQKEVDDEEEAQKALEAKRAAEKAEIAKLLSQLSSDKKEADKKEIQAKAADEKKAADDEKKSEEKTKELARKVVQAAKAEEEGSKSAVKAKAAAASKAKEVADKAEGDDAKANEVSKKMAALIAQIKADKAEAEAMKAKQDAEAKQRAESEKEKIAALVKQEAEAKSAKKKVAEEGEKRAVAAEEDQKAKAQAALNAAQAKAKAEAKAKADEEAEKAAAAKVREVREKQTAKDAAELAARKAAAAKVESAEQDTKAKAKAAAQKALEAQKAELLKMKAALLEQGQKMRAQIAAQAAKTAAMLAESKKQAAAQEAAIKTKAKNHEAELQAKQKAAEAAEEANKVTLKAKQTAAEAEARKVAARAAADSKLAKEKSAAEQAEKGKEMAIKKAAREAAVRERDEAKKAENDAKQKLKEAAKRQADEAKAKTAEAAKRAKAAADAKKKAELAAKDTKAKELKAARERDAKKAKAEALAKVRAAARAKEQAVKRRHGAINLMKRGRPLGNNYARPHYAIEGGLVVLQGAAHYDNVQTAHMMQLNKFALPHARHVFYRSFAHFSQGRVDVHKNGRMSAHNVKLADGSTSSYSTVSGMIYTRPGTARKKLQYRPHQYVTNYGGEYARLSYYKQGNLCVFEGLARTHRNGFNPIMRIPDECRTLDGYTYHSVATSGGRARLCLHRNGHMYFSRRPSHSDWLSLSGMAYFPDMRGRALPMEQGWRGYTSGYRPASVQRQGRLCVLSGYAHNQHSHNHGVFARLPANCRPSKELIFVTETHYGHPSRIHVRPDGAVVWREGSGHGSLLTLDGIRFVVGTPSFGVKQQKAEQRTAPLTSLAKGYLPARGAYAPPTWTVAGDLVVLNGLVRKNKQVTATTKLLSLPLPPKYLPRTNTYYALEQPGYFRLESHTEVIASGSGDKRTAHVQWRGGTAASVRPWVSLSGMVWLRPSARLESLQLHPHWTAAGKPFEKPSASRQGKLCVLAGAAVKRVGPHSLSHIGRLPKDCRPVDGDIIVMARAGKFAERLNIHRNGHMYRSQDRGYYGSRRLANRIVLDGITFNVEKGEETGVVPYQSKAGGQWRVPQFTVQDGICVLSGLMRHAWGGYRRPLLATLPSRCRPSKRLIFSGEQTGSSARIDVLPDGRVLCVSDRRGHHYMSLNGIVFRVGKSPEARSPRGNMEAGSLKLLADVKKGLGGLSEGVIEYGSGYQRMTYTVTGNLCQVNGRFRAGGLTRALLTLPAECRPRAVRRFTFARENWKVSPVLVKPDGTVRLEDHGSANDGDYVDVNMLFPVAKVPTTPFHLDQDYIDPAAETPRAAGFLRQGRFCVLDGYVTNVLHSTNAFGRSQYLTNEATRTIMHLPAGCRPAKRLIFNGQHGKYVWRVDVKPDGQVLLITRSGVQVNTLSLSDISFPVADGHALSMLNGWRSYTQRHHQSRYRHRHNSKSWFYRTPQWYKEGNLCSLGGLLWHESARPGNAHIADVPASCRPTGTLRFSGNQNQGPARFEVRADGRVFYIGRDDNRLMGHHNRYASLDGISWAVDSFEPSKRDQVPPSAEGVELKRENNYYPYSSHGQPYRRPMYTLFGNNNGVTVLSGVAAGPDVTATLATLPPKARNNAKQKFDLVGQEHRTGTLNVLPNGQIAPGKTRWHAQALGFVSLDGAIFANRNFRGANGLLQLHPYYKAATAEGVAPPRWNRDGGLCILSGSVRPRQGGKSLARGYIARVPQQCYPKGGRLIFNVNYEGYNVRLDLLTNGWLHFITGPSHLGDLPIDGIAYAATGNQLQNMFVPYGYRDHAGGYRKTGFARFGNLCVLSGLLTPSRGQRYYWSTLVVVPQKCRPKERMMFQVRQGSLGYARVDVLPDGRVKWADRKAQGGSWISLDGIRYIVPATHKVQFDRILPPGKVVSDKALSLYKPWTAAAQYSMPRVTVWGKLCVINGVARAPKDFKTSMFQVPNECRPAGRVALMARGTANGFGNHMRFDVGGSGDFEYVAGGGMNRALDVSVLTQLLVPKSVHTMPLQLQTTWSNYGHGYERPSYVKQGRFCILQGMVRLGDGTSTMGNDHWHQYAATAPPGCTVRNGADHLILRAGYHDQTLRVGIHSRNQVTLFSRNNKNAMHQFVSLSGVFYSPQPGTAIAPSSGWQRYHGSYRPAQYIVENGMCALTGSSRRRSGSPLAMVLPPNCRPEKAIVVEGTNPDNYYAYPMTIYPDGKVIVQSMPGAVSFDQIIFKARK